MAWPALDELPGVPEMVERARSAIAAVRRLPANRQGWARTAAAATIRAARASAVLDGGAAGVGRRDRLGAGPGAEPVGASGTGIADDSGVVSDPVLAGAIRANSAVAELAAVWRRAPLQALARLHTLAAADLVPEHRLGRPRVGPEVTQRLAALAEAATSAPWSGPVTVAVVHGELLALSPFDSANGVVARAAARVAMVTSGLDPQSLTVPEVGHLRSGSDYAAVAAEFATGAPELVGRWLAYVCRCLEAGASEARSIARAAGG